MAIERKDRVSDTTTTTGTGTVTLSGTAPDGYRAITDAHTTGATVRYAISLGAEWEVGEGVFTTSGNTLTRATVLASSNAGSLVNFSDGTKTVITTLTAAEVFSRDGDSMTGLLRLIKGSDITAAATTDLGTATGNSVDVTHSSGTVATTSLGGASLQAGTEIETCYVISGGTLTLTHHATNLYLAGGVDITLANGDVIRWRKMHDSNAEWKMVGGVKANGAAWVVAQSGILAQSLMASTANYVGLSTQIPIDDTIPQNTEGAEILTQAITPINASSKIRVTARMHIASPVGSGGTFVAALFKDSAANALAAQSVYCAAGGITGHVIATYEESASSTSARTYKLRGGPGSAITMYYNGDAGGRRFGGVSLVSLTVEEILP